MRPGPRSLSNLKPWPSPAGGQPKCCKVAPELPILYVVFSKSASVRPQASSTSKSEAESASSHSDREAAAASSFAHSLKNEETLQSTRYSKPIPCGRKHLSAPGANASKCADTARVHLRCRRSQEAKRHRGRRLILDLAHGERHVAVHQSF